MTDTMPRQNRLVIDNIVWFVASLTLAVTVWITAELDLDPIIEETLPDTFSITVLTDPDVIASPVPLQQGARTTSVTPATVIVRAQRSVFEAIDAADVEVIADYRGFTELGQQRVSLQGNVLIDGQVTVVSVTPNTIWMTLERREERLVPLVVQRGGEAPPSLDISVTPPEERRVQISGPADNVALVDEAWVPLNLGDIQESVVLDVDVRPVNLDEDGDIVERITVEPETVTVDIEVQQRSDVREVRVTPNILGEPPEGYTLTEAFDYSPQTVFVSGPQDVLDELPGTLFTAPIDLSEFTDAFEIDVPIELPDERLVLITGQLATVEVGIEAIQTSRQFERIPVETIGLEDGVEFTLAPAEVSVLVNGPQPILSGLQASDVRVIVDLNGLDETETDESIQVTPRAAIGNGEITEGSISVLPPTIDVQFVTDTDNSPAVEER